MTTELEELEKKMEKAKNIALSARVTNGVTFKYAKIIDDGELPKREDNNEVWTEVLIKEEYRTFDECASLYLDAKKAYETELDKHIPNKLEELKKEMEKAEIAWKDFLDEYGVAWNGIYFYEKNIKNTDSFSISKFLCLSEEIDLSEKINTTDAYHFNTKAFINFRDAERAYNKELNKNKNNDR